MDLKEFDSRLRNHDWFYSYSDDIRVYRHGSAAEAELIAVSESSPQHMRLYRAWVAYRNDASDTRADSLLKLQQVQIELGVTTQAELDAVVEERRQKDLQAAQAARVELVRYDELCNRHDWFYWRARYESEAYRDGLQQRKELTHRTKYGERVAVYAKLFRAWAKYHNEPQNQQASDELAQLRRELGLYDS